MPPRRQKEPREEMIPGEIFDLIAKYGPGVIFAIMWYLERDERKDSQKELKQLTRDTVTTMSEMKSLLGQVVTIFKPNGGQ
jgi:hypothetical protein